MHGTGTSSKAAGCKPHPSPPASLLPSLPLCSVSYLRAPNHTAHVLKAALYLVQLVSRSLGIRLLLFWQCRLKMNFFWLPFVCLILLRGRDAHHATANPGSCVSRCERQLVATLESNKMIRVSCTGGRRGGADETEKILAKLVNPLFYSIAAVLTVNAYEWVVFSCTLLVSKSDHVAHQQKRPSRHISVHKKN